MALIRVGLIALAVVVCGWFALGAHQTHDLDAATALVSGSAAPSPAQAQHISSLLSSAATLNPDRQVDVLRGELETAQRRYASARQTLSAVIRSEPQNLTAWIAYLRASPGDPTAFLRSLRAFKHLDPRL